MVSKAEVIAMGIGSVTSARIRADEAREVERIQAENLDAMSNLVALSAFDGIMFRDSAREIWRAIEALLDRQSPNMFLSGQVPMWTASNNYEETT